MKIWGYTDLGNEDFSGSMYQCYKKKLGGMDAVCAVDSWFKGSRKEFL